MSRCVDLSAALFGLHYDLGLMLADGKSAPEIFSWLTLKLYKLNLQLPYEFTFRDRKDFKVAFDRLVSVGIDNSLVEVIVDE